MSKIKFQKLFLFSFIEIGFLRELIPIDFVLLVWNFIQAFCYFFVRLCWAIDNGYAKFLCTKEGGEIIHIHTHIIVTR